MARGFSVASHVLVSGAVPSGEGIRLTEILSIATALITLVAAGIVLNAERIKSKNIEEKLNKLKKFANGSIMTRHVNSDLIMLGPRDHGKTSVVSGLTKQWMQVKDMRPTLAKFDRGRWESPNFRDEAAYDRDLEIDTVHRTRAVLTVFDYAGEDAVLGNAIKSIAESPQCVVAFVLSSEQQPKEYRSYFSVDNLKRIRRAIAQSNNLPLGAVILFTKQDMSGSFPSAPSEIPQVIHHRYQDIVQLIDDVFGNTSKLMVSAETGFGMAEAMRSILSHVVDAEGRPLN